jgi:hypothetical protein
MKLLLLADTESDRQNIMGILKIDYVNVIGDYIDEKQHGIVWKDLR